MTPRKKAPDKAAPAKAATPRKKAPAKAAAPTPEPEPPKRASGPPYLAGAVKQDLDTLSSATKVNDNLPGEWLVATVDRGAHFATEAEVINWVDLGPA